MGDLENEFPAMEHIDDPYDKIREFRNNYWALLNKGQNINAKKMAIMGYYLSLVKSVDEHVNHFMALIEYAGDNFTKAEELMSESSKLIRKSDKTTLSGIEALEDHMVMLVAISKLREAFGLITIVVRMYNKLNISTPPVRFFVRAAAICSSLSLLSEMRFFLKKAEAVNDNDILYLNNSQVLLWHYCHLFSKDDPEFHEIKDQLFEIQKKIIGNCDDWESDAFMLNNYGVLEYINGKYKESLEMLDKGLSLNKDISLLNFNKGLALYRDNRFEEAINSFNRALELYKRDGNAGYIGNALLFANICEMRLKDIKGEKIDDEDYLRFLYEFVDTIDESENFFTERSTTDAQFQEELLRKAHNNNSDKKLHVLKGWNSTYPPLFSSKIYEIFRAENIPVPSNESLFYGGGYYIKWNNIGIVIDPGFHFIRNFIEKRHCIQDINAIIVTSTMLDHVNDFEIILWLIKLINMLREDAIRNPIKYDSSIISKIPNTDKKIELIMTPDVYHVYMERLSNYYKTTYNSITLMDKKPHIQLECNDINNTTKSIRILPISNDIDAGRRIDQPYGFVLEFEDHDEGTIVKRIGFSSDTKWSKSIEDHYSNCDIVIVNMGPIKANEFRAHGTKNDRLSRQHLGLYGSFRFAKYVRPKLLLLADMGAELFRRRGIITSHFRKVMNEGNYNTTASNVLCTDIGMTIDLEKLAVQTEDSNEFTIYSDIVEKYNMQLDKCAYCMAK